ncbi:Hypothetical_protein [Hexamita inflata]|uniref:Hypothetical_protein n=1 Tax=Hexamita inflata TaxID=28002 RepID=A0AA86QK90_9EUKA|nr:Hypothetical protein HINF_LOCUS48694 [Hexamita inflata]
MLTVNSKYIKQTYIKITKLLTEILYSCQSLYQNNIGQQHYHIPDSTKSLSTKISPKHTPVWKILAGFCLMCDISVQDIWLLRNVDVFYLILVRRQGAIREIINLIVSLHRLDYDVQYIDLNCNILNLQLWEVELLFLVYYVSNYILKYFATSNADDKFQQIISSWRLFMNYSLTQEGQKYDFDRIRPQSTIQSRYLIFQKGKIEITTCNKRTAMTKINAVEDVQGRSTNSLNKLRQF